MAATMSTQDIKAVATQVSQPEKKKQASKDLQKTRLCVYFLEGKCGFGSSCTFAHSSNEVRGVPNLSKTQLCTKFMEGNCSDPNCTFAHGMEELRDSPNFKKKLCKWASKGACRNGAKCGFAHHISELRNEEPPPGVRPPPGFDKLKVPRPPPGLEMMGPDMDGEDASTEAPPSKSSKASKASKSTVNSQPDAPLFQLAAARGAAPIKQQVTLMSGAITALQTKLAHLEDMVLQSQVVQMQQQLQQLTEQCFALEAGICPSEEPMPQECAQSTKLSSKAAPFIPFKPANEVESDDASTSVGSESN